MKLVINIKETETAIKEVDAFRIKKYVNKDVRFTNIHLKKLNEKIRRNIFKKNDAYINSETLWDSMQEQGGSDVHNYHELTAEDIVSALSSIAEPYAVLKAKHERYSVITETTTHFGNNLFFIIEIGSGLSSNKNKNINKIVTMHAIGDDSIEKELKKNPVLYKK